MQKPFRYLIYRFNLLDEPTPYGDFKFATTKQEAFDLVDTLIKNTYPKDRLIGYKKPTYLKPKQEYTFGFAPISGVHLRRLTTQEKAVLKKHQQNVNDGWLVFDYAKQEIVEPKN